MVHTLRLDNYYPTPRKLVLGTNSSFGTESIKIERGAGWDGLNLTATWHIPGREEPLRVALLDGDAMDVPPEVTKEAKDGVLVLAGLASGVQRASCNVEYLIIEQAGVYGGADAEPTPELAAQVLEATMQAQQAAENAAADAAKAGPYAEAALTAKEAAEAASDDAQAAAQAAKDSADAANGSADDAANSAEAARNSASAASESSTAAGMAKAGAEKSANAAAGSATAANEAAGKSAASAAAAEKSRQAASKSEEGAADSADAAAASATQAGQSATAAAASAKAAASAVSATFYGVEFTGSTSAGTRTGAAADFVFTPGTDTVAGQNDFDGIYPWAGMVPMEQIIIALITAGLSLVGVMVTNYFNNKSLGDKVTHQLEVAQAVTDTKIEELTREVRMHNNFAQRVPVMEEKIAVANHRIDDLERHEENGGRI